MVEIRFLPPTRNISPKFEVLALGTTILRIFDPTKHKATATGFRYYGPLSRFDHHDTKKPQLDPSRGILYGGFSLSCCIVEIFGDAETVVIGRQELAEIVLTHSLKLLDLREQAAWDAGTVAAMVSDGQRTLTQAWGKYFYEHSQLFGEIDGLIFANAHNGEDAITLFERAEKEIELAEISTIQLKDPAILESIFNVANKLNLAVLT